MELSFGYGLELEQSQKLTLTPEMIQSLNILQYSTNDLIDFVLGQMDANPVIEMDNGDIFLREMGDSAGQQSDPQSYEDLYGEAEPDDWDSYDWYDFNENMSSYGYTSGGDSGMDYDNSSFTMDSYGISELTLEEYLMQQLDVCPEPFIIKAIGEFVIQTLDDNGYMTMSRQEIEEELHVTDEQVLEALRMLHGFEPAGIAAESLSECLALQAEAVGKLDDDMEQILELHLEDIAMNHIREVAKDLGIKPVRVQDIADLIRSFDPKPGSSFQKVESTRFIVPDVIVSYDEGRISVRLNENAIPQVNIRAEYGQMMSQKGGDPGVTEFLSGHISSAKWLARAIEQRCNTVLKVASAIVAEQRAFFTEGRNEIHPLTMKEIAERIGVHESTVSRAVNGKYLQSKQGVYELRFFVPGAGRFSGENGTDASADSMKKLIRQMVDKEDRHAPLSDRSIAEAIMITGVEISRRTVAKYREELGIPSSSLRRRV